jgi:hypothetical protein
MLDVGQASPTGGSGRACPPIDRSVVCQGIDGPAAMTISRPSARVGAKDRP